jgi:hypothetical protein
MTNPWAPLDQSMTTAGLQKGMPGWEIVKAAKLLPPTPHDTKVFGDSEDAALKKLMAMFYKWGRGHWTWTPSASGGAANGGMMKGGANNAACGTFNSNFKWLADKALGIKGMGQGQFTTHFLTMPGAVCLDTKWKGNVSTPKKGVGELKCFKFSGHWWVTHGGTNFDVCYNNTFGSPSEIIWTKLTAAPGPLLAKTGLDSGALFKLDKALPYGNYLMVVKKNGVNGWPEWQIVHENELPSKTKK